MRTSKVEHKAEKSTGAERTRLVFRFIDAEHHELVKRAAKDAGLSMNSWIVQATIREARKQLAAAK